MGDGTRGTKPKAAARVRQRDRKLDLVWERRLRNARVQNVRVKRPFPEKWGPVVGKEKSTDEAQAGIGNLLGRTALR